MFSQGVVTSILHIQIHSREQVKVFGLALLVIVTLRRRRRFLRLFNMHFGITASNHPALCLLILLWKGVLRLCRKGGQTAMCVLSDEHS